MPHSVQSIQETSKDHSPSNLTSAARKGILRERVIQKNLPALSSTIPPALPIRSNVEPKAISPSNRASAAAKERLKENARTMKDPCIQVLILFASMTERTLPLVEAEIVVDGLDVGFGTSDFLTKNTPML